MRSGIFSAGKKRGRIFYGFMADAVLNNISLVGNILIFCMGINLVWPRTIKVANLLPSLLIAVALTGIV